MEKKWFVYMIRCGDDSLYTGVTTDVKRRFGEHVDTKVGAKYTRAKKPKAVVYVEDCKSRGVAQSRESEIKKLKKPEKEKLIPN